MQQAKFFMLNTYFRKRIIKGEGCVFMDKKRQEDYHFVKEHIKKEPRDKKSFGVLVGRMAVAGAVFGVIAALVFCVFRPVFENLFSRPQQQVELPEEEVAEPEEKKEPEQVIIKEEQQMDLKDYQVLQNKLYSVGKKANRSVVLVTGVKNAKDWFNSDYETEGQGTGIILAETNQKYLIVTEKKLIADAKQIEVSFYNDETVEAQLVAYDGNTGIAVLGVEKKLLDKGTTERVSAAKIGSSNVLSQGTVVIAIGSPLGEAFSVLTGNVTAADNKITTADMNYDIITTDIVGTKNGSGALLNLDGQVVGLIMQGYSNADNRNTVTALGISKLKDLIERLSNGIAPAYLGLEISSVTEEIAREYHLPEGIYVKNVRLDSPAMEAGIQIGDVVVKMNDEDILTEAQYEEVIRNAKSGQQIRVTVKRMGADGKYQEVICTAALNILK